MSKNNNGSSKKKYHSSNNKIPKLRNAAECRDWIDRNQPRPKNVHRFEIWYAYLQKVRYGSSINKARPVLIISPDSVMAKTSTVTVLPLTSSTKRGSLPFNESIERAGDDSGVSTVLCDQIVTIDRHQLNNKIDEVSDEETRRKIEDALMKCLGLQAYSYPKAANA